MICIELLTRNQPTTDCASICVTLRLHGFHAEKTNTLQFNTDATPALIDKVVTTMGCTFAEVIHEDDVAYLDEMDYYLP